MRIIDLIIVIPLGILMSGPFAVWGTIGGTVIGFVAGLLLGAWLF